MFFYFDIFLDYFQIKLNSITSTKFYVTHVLVDIFHTFRMATFNFHKHIYIYYKSENYTVQKQIPSKLVLKHKLNTEHRRFRYSRQNYMCKQL